MSLDFQVSEEFLEEQLCQTMPKSEKKGGPYSKQDKQARRNEVYRYHFDYGHSARKISDILKINRNTINGDINYWYSKIVNDNNIFNPEYVLLLTTERLDIQRTRLREDLAKLSSIQEKITVERMIFDIDSKLSHIHLRLAESTKRSHEIAISYVNNYLKDNKKQERYFTFGDKFSVTQKSQKNIEKIIKEDKKNLWRKQN